jgi:hypothetical protein
LKTPEATSHEEQVFWDATKDAPMDPVAIKVGSSMSLLDEVLDLAPALAIPLRNGKLIDGVAGNISSLEPLEEHEEDPELLEDLRPAWLHEAARLSIELDVAMTLGSGSHADAAGFADAAHFAWAFTRASDARRRRGRVDHDTDPNYARRNCPGVAS